MGEGEHQTTPLLTSHSTSSNQLDGSYQRTGTLWTGIAHIITAVIGSGVLSLAWSMAQLGWIAGSLSMLAFAGITIVSSFLLCDCYRPDDSENGEIRNRTYMDAVRFYLGKRSVWACGAFQQISLYGTSIAYTITSSISMSVLVVLETGALFKVAFSMRDGMAVAGAIGGLTVGGTIVVKKTMERCIWILSAMEES